MDGRHAVQRALGAGQAEFSHNERALALRRRQRDEVAAAEEEAAVGQRHGHAAQRRQVDQAPYGRRARRVRLQGVAEHALVRLRAAPAVGNAKKRLASVVGRSDCIQSNRCTAATRFHKEFSGSMRTESD